MKLESSVFFGAFFFHRHVNDDHEGRNCNTTTVGCNVLPLERTYSIAYHILRREEFFCNILIIVVASHTPIFQDFI